MDVFYLDHVVLMGIIAKSPIDAHKHCKILFCILYIVSCLRRLKYWKMCLVYPLPFTQMYKKFKIILLFRFFYWIQPELKSNSYPSLSVQTLEHCSMSRSLTAMTSRPWTNSLPLSTTNLCTPLHRFSPEKTTISGFI